MENAVEEVWYDADWVALILEAKIIGMSAEEVREYIIGQRDDND